MDEMKNVPEIRFGGFSDEWKTSTLNSLVDLENGFAFKGEYFQENESEYIVLTPGNVNIGGGFQFGKGNNYNPEGEFPEKAILKSGEIFLTMTDLTPTAQTLGFPAIVPNDGKTYLHNQRLGKLVNINCDINFLFQLLCGSSYQNQVVRSSSGTTVKHTSPERILKTSISYPKETEQKQLSQFFDNIDNLQKNHNTQLTKLTNLKKAMLIKMFPQDGASVPEIRFKGFDGEWERIKLGEYCNFRRGSFPQPYGNPDWYDGANSLPFVQVVDVGFNLSLVKNTKQRISLLAQSQSVFVKKGSVVVTLQGSIGRVAILDYDAYVDRTILIFESYKKLTDSRFWAYIIQQKFKTEEKMAPGGTIKTITKEVLANFVVSVTDYKEQQKIGNYFKSLDDLIENHKEQLKKLNQIKKACLSKLFVAQD